MLCLTRSVNPKPSPVHDRYLLTSSRASLCMGHCPMRVMCETNPCLRPGTCHGPLSHTCRCNKPFTLKPGIGIYLSIITGCNQTATLRKTLVLNVPMTFPAGLYRHTTMCEPSAVHTDMPHPMLVVPTQTTCRAREIGGSNASTRHEIHAWLCFQSVSSSVRV